MSKFSYKAIDRTEKVVFGSIIADSEAIAKINLESKGYNILSIKKKIFNFELSGTILSPMELVNFFGPIGAMDKVGIDILKAMELMKDEIAATSNIKKVSRKIHGYILNGDPFSAACKRASKSFTDDFIGLIAIAERTGKFSSVFDEIVQYIKWNADISAKAKKAIRGPLATLIFMVAMIVVMSVFALPKILEFLKYFNMKPPMTTIALIYFASFVKKTWIFFIALSFAWPLISTLFGMAFKSFAISRDRMKLFFPIFGQLNLKIDTSRFIAFFGLMYNSGADMVDIINGVSKVVKNHYLAWRVKIIANKVMSGSTIFKAIDEETIFPVMFRKMMAICEATGEVGPVLENVRDFYDKETKNTIEQIIATIKPIMTILLGGMLMWIGSAMMGPIYSNIANMGDVSSSSSSSSKEGE